jgi:hypothetical protein
MPGFWDNPMFTSPNTPNVMRYPGTPFAGLLPPWAYNTPWPPPTANTPPLPPATAAPPPSPAALPLPIPPARPPSFAPSLAAPPATSAVPQDPTNNNIAPTLANPLASHAATLMALGAGIAQGGIGKGLAMASAAAENERNRAAQQMSFLQTYKALTDSGVPQQEAIAAVSNPSLMRTLAARYLGARSQANAAGSAGAPPANTPPSSVSLNGATAPSAAAPPTPGVRQASDGKWYVADPNRLGKYLMVP